MIEFSTTTSLLPHQEAAVGKLRASRVGALFMEMGTGKTRTAFELVHLRRGRISRVVYFCPVSLRHAVLGELVRHTDVAPEDVCIVAPGVDDAGIRRDAAWYIVGVESMGGSDRMYMAVRGLVTHDTYAIVDESTYIKGYTAKRTVRITQMCAGCRYRLLMTGTPLTQGIIDLYAQMRFLSEDILGYKSFYSFQRMHIRYSERFPGLIEGYRHADWIAAKVQPYVYQVLKSECVSLPPKVYSTRHFRMTMEQWMAYEAVRDEACDQIMEADARGRGGSKVLLAIFRMFTKLQEIVCGYLNEGGETREFGGNPRLDALRETLDAMEDGKAVIYARDLYSIRRIAEMLGGSCVVLTGEVPAREREEAIRRFAGDARYLVATQSCAGHGFTFTMARRMVFYNDGFKFSERVQAEDRIHRIGQTEQCEYVSLVCDDSIDERIQRALSCKEDALRSFRDDVDRIRDKKGRLSKEKLKEMFNRL